MPWHAMFWIKVMNRHYWILSQEWPQNGKFKMRARCTFLIRVLELPKKISASWLHPFGWYLILPDFFEVAWFSLQKNPFLAVYFKRFCSVIESSRQKKVRIRSATLYVSLFMILNLNWGGKCWKFWWIDCFKKHYSLLKFLKSNTFFAGFF